MGPVSGSTASPGCNSPERSVRSGEALAEIAGGATFVTAAVPLGLLGEVAYFGIGRGIGRIFGFELGSVAAKPLGFNAVDCCAESGEAFLSAGTISAMLSLR